jgi:tetratricopeptide (TPR) repeat protein
MAVRSAFIRSLLVLLVCGVSVRAADVLLTLPFENVSGKAEYNWVGESFVVQYADLLENPGLRVIDPAERNQVYLKLGLRPQDILTRAAVIRVAETANANLALVGTYDIGGDAEAATIAISARLIEVTTGRLVGNKVFNFSGHLADLQGMQGQLAWNLLHERNHATTVSKDQLVTAAKAVPTVAFESYVKGIQTQDAKVRESWLKRALKEYPRYSAALYELGVLYYRQREYLPAVEQLRQLQSNAASFYEGQFYLGLAAHALGNVQEAVTAYDQIVATAPLTEVLNNDGVLWMLKGDTPKGLNMLRRAVVQTPTDARCRFNLGYALWRAQQFNDAILQLKTVVTLQPADGEATYLLAKSLQAAGQQAEATKYDEQAKKIFSNYARWAVAMDKIPSLYRLAEECNQVELLKFVQQNAPPVVTPPVGPTGAALPNAPAPVSVEQIRQLIQAGKETEALDAAQRLLSAETTNSEAHYWRGVLLQKRADNENALSAWQSAVYWNPRHVAAHLALSKFYLSRNERALALTYARHVLQLDAQNREALALKQQIENGKE